MQSIAPLTACSCCPAIYTLACWRALPFVGIQHGGELPLELRNCECGSTLAIELEVAS